MLKSDNFEVDISFGEAMPEDKDSASAASAIQPIIGLDEWLINIREWKKAKSQIETGIFEHEDCPNA